MWMAIISIMACVMVAPDGSGHTIHRPENWK